MFTTLEKIGLLCISIVGFQLVRVLFKFIYSAFIAPQIGKINASRIPEFGKWALITGATDGIGKAYAETLAERGLNIILISRTLEKLQTVAAEIKSKYDVEVKTISADFTAGDDIYEQIEKQCTDLEIGVLVNNVGMSYPYPEYFLSLPDGDQMNTNLIRCNVFSVTKMCKLFMPGMVNRGRGIVINVSSAAAQFPSPLLTVYSATKAYVQKFSDDLSTEYSKQGIIIQCLLPGYVATNMSKIRSSTWMAPTPKKYVAHALNTLGVESSTNGYYPHLILVSVINGLETISPKLSRWLTLRTMLNIRSRALKRSASAR